MKFESWAFGRTASADNWTVRNWFRLIAICLVALPGFCQSTPKYQVGTIVEVKPHQTAQDGKASDAVSYDVSLRVGNTIYVGVYTPPLGENTVKYAAGRDLLVLVGKKTITYNDILGRSSEVPILSQRPAAEPKQSK
jgi:hypothetical protein